MRKKRERIKEKKTLYSYVKNSFILITVCISVLMEAANLHSIYFKNKGMSELYRQELEFYCDTWAAKMELLNNGLLLLKDITYNSAYFNMKLPARTLELELAKKEFQGKIQDIDDMNHGEFNVFYYFSENDIFLRGSSAYYSYQENEALKEALMQRIDSGDEEANSTEWRLVETGQGSYLMNVYKGEYGYIGAVLKLALIAEDIGQILDQYAAVAVTDQDGQPIEVFPDVFWDGQRIARQLEGTACQLVILIDWIGLLKNNLLLLLEVIAGMAIVVTFALRVVRANESAVLRPLMNLKEGMDKFGEGEINLQLQTDSQLIEIDSLYSSFNNMTEQIKNLKIDVYEAQLARQQMEYSFLQVQIRPHFYTNVLNLIYGLAEIRDYRNIQELSMAMANYFRYLLNHKQDFVPLSNELICVGNYVKIQQLRYPGSIVYEQIGEADGDILVPPILIQTFVENSIHHNVTVVPEIRIELILERENENGMLVIWIRDNGGGFDEDILVRLNREEDISREGKHIGIYNVMERLRVLYPEGNAGIEISNWEHGARVKIQVPVIGQKGSENR